ncbi:toll/interleukin-1 receptor domain-containing protein [Mesorhizobium denitrificans]|nr:toll/interleukin-1 receptor domain-containing protein [Mesorhizobium denitrificans]
MSAGQGAGHFKVFVSWSGDSSQAVAKLLHNWLPNVLQTVRVFVSSKDIKGGERWYPRLAEELESTNFGIVIVTRSNKEAPWIQFEAGALSKHVEGRVVPLLCQMKVIELTGNPLQAFQAAEVSKDGILSLVRTLNGELPSPLLQQNLEETFEVWWPKFEVTYAKIEFSEHEVMAEPTPAERMERIERAITFIQSDVRKLVHDQNVQEIAEALLGNRRDAMRRPVAFWPKSFDEIKSTSSILSEELEKNSNQKGLLSSLTDFIEDKKE